jgi:hypothetical protein
MEIESRAARRACFTKLTFLDVRVVHEIPLAAVPEQTFTFAGIVYDVLRQPLRWAVFVMSSVPELALGSRDDTALRTAD